MLSGTVKHRLVVHWLWYLRCDYLFSKDVLARIILQLRKVSILFKATVDVHAYNIMKAIEKWLSQIYIIIKNDLRYFIRMCMLYLPDFGHRKFGEFDHTVLMIACEIGDIEMVSMLLTERNINVNAQNSDGGTALMIACMSERENIVRILLSERDIDVNVVDYGGWSALLHTAWTSDTCIGDMLLQDPRIKPEDMSCKLYCDKDGYLVWTSVSGVSYKSECRYYSERLGWK